MKRSMQLDRAVGLGRVRVWHLNDSRRERGSRVDRHAGIGPGQHGPGAVPARSSTTPGSGDLPMILETPKGTEEGEDLDAVNLRTLRQLDRRVRLPTAGLIRGR